MAVESRISGDANRLQTASDGTDSIKNLLKQLADDGSQLLQQELALAKIEMKETASVYAADGARIGIALVLSLLGGLALTAFLIIALGKIVLNDNYWLSSLIVAVVFLAIGGVMVKGAIGDMKKHSLTPDATMGTLKADQRWAQREVKDLKESVKS